MGRPKVCSQYDPTIAQVAAIIYGLTGVQISGAETEQLMEMVVDTLPSPGVRWMLWYINMETTIRVSFDEPDDTGMCRYHFTAF